MPQAYFLLLGIILIQVGSKQVHPVCWGTVDKICLIKLNNVIRFWTRKDGYVHIQVLDIIFVLAFCKVTTHIYQKLFGLQKFRILLLFLCNLLNFTLTISLIYKLQISTKTKTEIVYKNNNHFEGILVVCSAVF